MTKIRCNVCFNKCNLSEGQVGICHARGNIKGEIVSINYGKITALNLDPIRKKPLVKFFPESKILSVGSFGCNMKCPFCQNSSIAIADGKNIKTRDITPAELVELAKKYVSAGNIGVAYTYNEPMIGYEFVRDTAKEVKKQGMKNVVVTNGSVSKDILLEVLPFVDAFNIDLKGFTEEYYKWLGGDLSSVMEFITIATEKAHVELTTLIVPDKNDSEEEMKKMARWVASINPEIPLHLSRFFPQYIYLDNCPTDIEKLHRLKQVAEKYLKTVVLGNV